MRTGERSEVVELDICVRSKLEVAEARVPLGKGFYIEKRCRVRYLDRKHLQVLHRGKTAGQSPPKVSDIISVSPGEEYVNFAYGRVQKA